MQYLNSFTAMSWLKDLEDKGQSKRSLCATYPLTLLIICIKYGKNPSSTERVVDWTRQDVPYRISFDAKLGLNHLEDVGRDQRSLCGNTQPRTSGYLCQMWKESINNRLSRADTRAHHGRTYGPTDRQAGIQYTPQPLRPTHTNIKTATFNDPLLLLNEISIGFIND